MCRRVVNNTFSRRKAVSEEQQEIKIPDYQNKVCLGTLSLRLIDDYDARLASINKNITTGEADRQFNVAEVARLEASLQSLSAKKQENQRALLSAEEYAAFWSEQVKAINGQMDYLTAEEDKNEKAREQALAFITVNNEDMKRWEAEVQTIAAEKSRALSLEFLQELAKTAPEFARLRK
jgi:chromosome segregation ATPase